MEKFSNPSTSNTLPEEGGYYWEVTTSYEDEEIMEFSKSLLDDPRMTTEEGDLYTKEQMLEMFRLGCSCISSSGRERKVKTTKKPYSLLRNMDIGDEVFFSFGKWNAVRSSASTLKRQFGCVYKVSKIGKRKEVNDIKVIRIE